jgi:hypothetical protein
MGTYLCKRVQPNPSEVSSVFADNPEDAANTFFFKNGGGYSLRLENEVVSFAVVAVEGAGEFLARRFASGIFRKGGIKHPCACESLEEAAKKLGVDVKELGDDGWIGEEPYEKE